LLGTHRDALDQIVALLIEKEVIDGNELVAIIRQTGVEPASRSGAAAAAGVTGSFEWLDTLPHPPRN
jgi:hypothetical protein